MWNSLKVAVPSTLLCAYFSAMTAYALAMYKFKGNKVLFMTILIFMMIPGQLGLIGFYNLCTKLHLVNSYIPLIIPAIASPGTVFFLRQYVLSVMPPSLIDIKNFGFIRECISLSSSLQACPDTWASWKITSAPFAESSLITRETDFSFPGIGFELKMIVSFGLIVIFLWIFAAILERAVGSIR